MSLVEQIAADLKSAMLAKDADRTATLRMLKSAIGYAQMEKRNENLSAPEVIAVIQREAKKRKDAIAEYERASRTELVTREKAELGILESFLPKQLSAEELESLVRGAISESGATGKKDMGAVMKLAQSKAAGRADGKTLSAIVSRLLP